MPNPHAEPTPPQNGARAGWKKREACVRMAADRYGPLKKLASRGEAGPRKVGATSTITLIQISCSPTH